MVYAARRIRSPTPYPRRIPRGVPLPYDLSEAEFTLWVKHQAERRGWCGYHVRDSEGAVEGLHSLVVNEHNCAMGFPDWVFVREDPPGFLIRELKTNTGLVGREQKRWIRLLKAARIDADWWRPRDEARVLAELT